MRRLVPIAASLAGLAFAGALAGCTSGRIYKHVVVPLDTNLDGTPVYDDSGETGAGNIEHLHIPLSNVDLDFQWDSNAIGDIARHRGIEQIYYADLETFSILGVWNQYTVHIYGKPAPKPAEETVTRAREESATSPGTGEAAPGE